MSKIYSDWLGRQVVLQIETCGALIPLRGLVVTESNTSLRFRLDGCWEVDIYKEMILRVETDNDERFQLGDWEAANQPPVAARSRATPVLRHYRVFDRWFSNLCSCKLSWKIICAAGLTGCILSILALQLSATRPFAQFARFLGAYLGLLFCAVSLGCGLWLLIDSIATHSHSFGKWPKRFASFLDWFRQPIHL